MNCKWINIDKGIPDDETLLIVFLTINNKLVILKNPSDWHISKYNITHYLILPKL